MKPHKLLGAIVASLILLAAPLRADDIDLYTGGEAFTGAETNVLIFLDNSANWSNASGWPATQGEAELDALKTVIDTLNDNVNVGVMMHTQTGSANTAYVRFAMRPMNAANKLRLKEVFDDIKSTAPNAPQDKVSQSANGDLSIEETYRYFNGRALGQPTLRDKKEDYLNNTDYYINGGGVSVALEAKSHPATTGTLGFHAYDSASAGSYNAFTSASLGCAKNYIIWIGNTSLAGTTDGTRMTAAAATSGITLASTYTSQITTYQSSNTAPQGLMLDEWARFMNTYGVKTTIDDPQNPSQKLVNKIVTYTVDVFPAATEPKACIGDTAGGAQQVDQHYVMQSTANAGGGKCFPATNTAQLSKALSTIFAEIQAVNSVFASATLPISVNTQGTFENQVYIGVFRPDQYARPRWYGNLKEYQFARYCDTNNDDLVTDVGGPNDERIDREAGNTGTVPTCTGDTLKLFLADRSNRPAIDQTLTTGFIGLTATSLWTQDSTFWSFSPVAPTNNDGASDAADGPNVERGGAAYRQRTLFPVKTAASGTADIDHRKVYTCIGNCLLPAATAAERALANNPLTTANTGVMTRLNSNWPKSVTLARSGGTVTGTTTTAHGLSTGNSVTISGTGVAAYDTTFSVATVPTTTTFTFAVTEKPATPSVGTATVGGVTVSKTGSSISIDATGTLATFNSTAHGFSAGDTVTISGATQQFLNGQKTLSNVAPNSVTANSFTFSIAPLPAAGVAAAKGTAALSAPASASAPNIDLLRYNVTDKKRATAVWTNAIVTSGSGKNVTLGTTTATITGASTGFNGTFTIADAGSSCPGASNNNPTYGDTYYNQRAKVFCFDLIKDENGTFTATRTTGGVAAAITITRSGSTATAIAAAPIGAGNATVNVTIGASPSGEYDGTYNGVTLDATGTIFSFNVTTTPAAAASGNVSLVGAPTVANSTLIEWVRGVDNRDDENQNSSFADVRASIQGDVLHSRPLLINYGGSIGVVGFYGSNDGFLRAIKGGTADTDGGEKWAFIADEFLNPTRLARQYDNTPVIRLPNSACSASPTPLARDYYWDGQLTVYQSTATVKYPDATTGPYTRPQKSYLYAGMRRGGRAIYALDVSDPDVPSFLWKIDSNSTGFGNLGYTWSEPKVARIKGKQADNSDDPRDVLIFGGGYDPTDDDQPSGCPRGDHSAALSTVGAAGACPNAAGSYTGIGRGVYIVDALTGALIKYLAPPTNAVKYSMPSDLTLLDMDGDGYVDRIYGGDSGGQLFRFDIDGTQQLSAGAAFKSYFLASVGDITSVSDLTRNGGTNARKILYPPEVLPFVYTKSDGTSVAATLVLFGTGDREKPLNNYDSNGDLNTLTCGTLYNSPYFGRKIRDRIYAYVDTVAPGADELTVNTTANLAIDGDIPNPTSGSDFKAVNTSDPTDRSSSSLTSFNLCYAFESTCVPSQTNTIYKGWYLNLKNTVSASASRDEEKLVNAPKVVSGLLLFGTSTPQAPDTSRGVCSNLGQALSYSVNPFTGMPSFNRDRSVDGSGNDTFAQNDYAAVVTGGGLPPTVTAGVVGIGGGFYRFIIGAGGTGAVSASPIAGAKNPITLRGTRSRVYWYYPTDEK